MADLSYTHQLYELEVEFLLMKLEKIFNILLQVSINDHTQAQQ